VGRRGRTAKKREKIAKAKGEQYRQKSEIRVSVSEKDRPNRPSTFWRDDGQRNRNRKKTPCHSIEKNRTNHAGKIEGNSTERNPLKRGFRKEAVRQRGLNERGASAKEVRDRHRAEGALEPKAESRAPGGRMIRNALEAGSVRFLKISKKREKSCRGAEEYNFRLPRGGGMSFKCERKKKKVRHRAQPRNGNLSTARNDGEEGSENYRGPKEATYQK